MVGGTSHAKSFPADPTSRVGSPGLLTAKHHQECSVPSLPRSVLSQPLFAEKKIMVTWCLPRDPLPFFLHLCFCRCLTVAQALRELQNPCFPSALITSFSQTLSEVSSRQKVHGAAKVESCAPNTSTQQTSEESQALSRLSFIIRTFPKPCNESGGSIVPEQGRCGSE